MTLSKAHQEIVCAASGDRAAFRRLVLTHQSNVRGTLLQLTGFDHSRTDDLAQDIFLIIFQRLPSFRFESEFSTWLYRITYNVFIDDQRKRNHKFSETAASELNMTSMNDHTRTDIREDLKKAMAQLREEERVAVVYTSLEELTHEEAALAMGLSLGTLKTHVLRGKEHLRKILIAKGWEIDNET